MGRATFWTCFISIKTSSCQFADGTYLRTPIVNLTMDFVSPEIRGNNTDRQKTYSVEQFAGYQ